MFPGLVLVMFLSWPDWHGSIFNRMIISHILQMGVVAQPFFRYSLSLTCEAGVIACWYSIGVIHGLEVTGLLGDFTI